MCDGLNQADCYGISCCSWNSSTSLCEPGTNASSPCTTPYPGTTNIWKCKSQSASPQCRPNIPGTDICTLPTTPVDRVRNR